MKYIYIIMCLLFGLHMKAQGIDALPISTFSKAKIQLDQNHFFYNPNAGFITCKKAAEEEQNPKAMNLLAILYSQGIGTDENQEKALEWFKNAAENGYYQSWYNVGLMHQNGLGTIQDFSKAFQYFSKGADIGAVSSQYGLGYLYYKGLGCKQSYPKAIELFKQAVNHGSLGSMYLLGLCYRNGYGITKNQDSARYWLTTAAHKGYEFAKNEMMDVNPEHQEYPDTKKAKSAKKENQPVIKAQFENVKHTLTVPEDLNGHYTGHIVTYDWSGKHIVANNVLELEITPSKTNNSFTGTWVENNEQSVSISGAYKDSKVVFNNTSYFKTDHYSAQTPIEFLFKDATFTSVTHNGTTYLSGNLRLWDAKRNEPEKPMYISLVKTNTAIATPTTISQNPNFIVVPNPFDNSFSFNLSLHQEAWVTVNLYAIDGSNLYTEKIKLAQGNHKHTVQVAVPSGSYVLKVSYGSEVKKSIVVKS